MSANPNLTKLRETAQITIDEYGGILPQFEAFYLHSILYPARRSLASFGQLSEISDPTADAEHAISIAQEAVGHAAALSRFFWPAAPPSSEPKEVRKLHKARAAKLRAAFDLDNASPLYKRHLRDAWEHFDERLDRYMLSAAGGLVFPEPLIDTHELADDPLGHVFKLLDLEAECLVLLGKKYFYCPIRDEVNRIHEVAADLVRQGGRLRL